MDDLVRVAAEQEVAGLLQRGEHQGELRHREVLHFVDHHEVVARCGVVAPLVRDQVAVVEARLGKPGAIAFVQVVESRAVGLGEDRLAHAECEVLRRGRAARSPRR